MYNLGVGKMASYSRDLGLNLFLQYQALYRSNTMLLGKRYKIG